ncbi:MAG: 2-amino-4-hydroxy-6-hydroxymethyldihydropteridine diphosphokinase [Hyphomicrobiaceae bacterium]
MEALFAVASLRVGTKNIWIGLGANIPGTWGEPAVSLHRAMIELGNAGFHIFAHSPLYRTRALGIGRQPAYLNMVIGMRKSIGPAQLLQLLKRLEREAGRRKRGHWQPRPLDLDILDFGGRVVGRPGRKRSEGLLLLPHPELLRRGFALVPLAEVAAGWRHPLIGVGAREMLARAPHLARDVERCV